MKRQKDLVLGGMKQKHPASSGATNPFASQFISEADCSALLHVLPRTLRHWRQTRALPHVKITSKHILYKRADIDAWLAKRTVSIAA